MANKFLDSNGLLYLWQKIKDKFVAKETGKGLSANDFTNEYKSKVDNSATAQSVTDLTSVVGNKVDKDGNKVLSTNDYTTEEKNKLAGLKNTIVIDNLESTSAEDALSAKQGKILNERITQEVKNITDNLSDFGAGDMLKNVYDADNNGQVDKADDSDKLGGQLPDYYAKADDIPSKVSELENDKGYLTEHQSLEDYATKTDLNKYVPISSKGQGNGVASLDSYGKVPTSQLPATTPTAHTHETSEVTGLDSALGNKVNTSTLAQPNGVATLDGNGKIPSTQLPSYVDDVIEGYLFEGQFYQEASHTTLITGESGKIYIDITDNKNLSYRYGGSTYVQITSSDMVSITNAEIDSIVAS